MLTRLREGTPDAADRGRAGAASADNPEAIGGAPLSIGKLGHSFGELRAIERIDLDVEPGEVVGNRRPVGLRQDHAAGAGRGAAASGRRDHLGRRPHRPGARGSRAARTCRSGTSSSPGSLPSTTHPWLFGSAGCRGHERAAQAAEHFERLGLEGFEGSRPDQLSGGMRQRVAFLRTLMAGRPVLLLDEPFASLDAITRAEMQSWLAEVLEPDRHTVLLVTHDVEEALYLSDSGAGAQLPPGSRRRPDRGERVRGPRIAPRPSPRPQFAELRQRALRSLAGAAQ